MNEKPKFPREDAIKVAKEIAVQIRTPCNHQRRGRIPICRAALRSPPVPQLNKNHQRKESHG